MKVTMSREDYKLVDCIVARAVSELGFSRTAAFVDITSCHENNPLNLEGLLHADSSDFAHDIYGISAHLNQSTYELEDFFVPRYSKNN